jgi:hypothetical protein
MGFLDTIKKMISPGDERRSADIIEQGFRELAANHVSAWSAKPVNMPQTTDALQGLTDKDRVQFVVASMKRIHQYYDGKTSHGGSDPEYEKASTAMTLLTQVLKTKLLLDEEDVEMLAHGFMTYRRGGWADLSSWPINLLIAAVERNFEKRLPEKAKKSIEAINEGLVKLNRTDKDTVKLIDKIDSFLFKASGGNMVRPTFFLGQDRFSEYANDTIKQQPEEDKQTWYKLMQLAQKASGSKPSAKFLEQSKLLIKVFPGDRFKNTVTDWFDHVTKMKEHGHENTYTYGNGNVVNYVTYEFLASPNIDALKGFVWMCCHFHDTHTLQVIAALCERSFRKIPGHGPAAAAVGNACLFALFKSKGLEGIAHLSRLKLRIKQSNTQTLIDKYLQEAADAQGISVNEIEDLAVDDFDLQEGKREYEIDGYKAILSVQGIGDVKVDWFKPDNSSLKGVPSLVKEKYSGKLKKIRDIAKQIEIALVAQRDRIDRMFRSQREMTWAYFTKHYFNHGLLSLLSRRILWRFCKAGEDAGVCIFLHGQWVTLQGQDVQPDDSFTVSLWHPATATVAEIRAWRKLLMEEQIRQPIKQAFREVYLLTDAEVNTRTYSNRMAAHILKQHQFNSLAKMRGWKYSLLGAYDDGRYNEGATLALPQYNLRAEFWVNEVNAENQYNDTGIWNYVSTDQVRFSNPDTQNPVDLISIPPVIFSEVMRDVDLFVGVASVGNDPTWSDNSGVLAYQNYWQAYSFGDLTEIAKTRKEILENLVPRLKIASVATVKDKFLIVTGKKRIYKIHIGSTNILMEPNDQYLCIVPDRSKKDITGNVFLPFEGDAGLSVILSKAMLLADDDKIKDPTIISQIDRK